MDSERIYSWTYVRLMLDFITRYTCCDNEIVSYINGSICGSCGIVRMCT